MTKPTSPLEALNIAQADHAILAQAIKNFRRLFMGDRPPTSTKEFGEIQELITKKIAEHFAEEENLVFPLLTVDSPDQQMTQAIAELCQEHSQLLAEANRLGNQLHRRDIAHCTGELWTALLDFFTAFEKHAAKEDQLYKFYT